MALGCLVACTTPGAGTVSTWKYEVSAGGSSSEITLTFRDDNSWSYKATSKQGNYTVTSNMSGTYTGDASKDGTIELTLNDVSVNIPNDLKEAYEAMGIDIEAEYAKMKGTKTQGTISGNKLTFGAGIMMGSTFTKQ